MFEEVESSSTFVDFWNDVLVPKFVRFRHILVDGLSKHSEAAYEIADLGPGDGARSCGPGPFSMADRETVTQQMEIAGYTDVDFQRVDAPVMVGNDIDDAVAFQFALGPTGEVYREAGEEAEARKDEIHGAMSEALSEYLTDDGIVLMSSSWIITATNPARA